MNIINASLPSRFDGVSGFIHEALERLGKSIALSEQEVFDIKLVLEEAITNAIKHGNKFNQDLTVHVAMTLDGPSLIISVKDQGQGFDVKKVPDPTQKEGLTKTSGRGVFLMMKLMDQVEYSDGGREITMVKNFSRERK